MRFKRDKNIFKKHLFELNKDLEDAEIDSIEETRKEGKWTGGIGVLENLRFFLSNMFLSKLYTSNLLLFITKLNVK